jgi:hypothetical protein
MHLGMSLGIVLVETACEPQTLDPTTTPQFPNVDFHTPELLNDFIFSSPTPPTPLSHQAMGPQAQLKLHSDC